MKKKIMVSIVFLLVGLIGYFWNNEHWVSLIEGILFWTSNEYDPDKLKQMSDFAFLLIGIPLTVGYCSTPKRLKQLQPVLIVFMILLLLTYLPVVHDDHPGLLP